MDNESDLEPAVSTAEPATAPTTAGNDSVHVKLKINGKDYALDIDPRVTLLDALRERLQLTGSKKSCDHAQWGACTVQPNIRRRNSGPCFAALHHGDQHHT